jgi:hypothetical protein
MNHPMGRDRGQPSFWRKLGDSIRKWWISGIEAK